MIYRYSLLSRILHWVSAIVIIWASCTGFAVAFKLIGKPTCDSIAVFNVALTLTFIPFFILRVGYAIFSEKPQTPELSRLQQLAAHCGHHALYVTVSVVLVSGVLMMDRTISAWGIIEFPPVNLSSLWHQRFSHIHHYACMVLALLVIGHIAAVIKHEMKGVKLLSKMT